jgi:hypothetical protein
MIRPWKVFATVAVSAAVLPCSAMAQAPSISITSPGGTGVYKLNEVVNAAYTCSGANVASCEGAVAVGQPINTGTLGGHNFVVAAKNAEGLTLASSTVQYQVTETGSGGGGGDVPATLDLTLGTPTAFAPFVPGVAQDYTSTVTAQILSTALDTTLTVADAGETNVGKMVNGTFALPQTVQVGAVKAATGAPTEFKPLGGMSNPTTLLTYADPVSGTANVTFKQSVAATDALRTGSYSKTLTFTLSTTNP